MLALLLLILKYQDHLSLFSKIAQPIAYVFFQYLDLPLYVYVYNIAYGCTEKDNGRDIDDVVIPASHAPAPAY